jgi:hypothetical protein
MMYDKTYKIFEEVLLFDNPYDLNTKNSLLNDVCALAMGRFIVYSMAIKIN